MSKSQFLCYVEQRASSPGRAHQRGIDESSDATVSLVAAHLRRLIQQRLGVRVPADGQMTLGRDLVLWVHGYRINLVDGEQTLLSGRLYANPVRMAVSHPEIGIDIDVWRPGVWRKLILATPPG